MQTRSRRSVNWLNAALVVIAAGLAIGASMLRFDRSPAALEAQYAGPDSRFVTADGIRFHITDRGQGPVLLLLHGQSANFSVWEAAAMRLAADHRVINVDLPGHGLTGPDPQGRYALPLLAESIGALADALGLSRFTLAGNSLGGGVALEYALLHPERLDALVLVDAVGAPVTSSGPLAFRLELVPVVGQLAAWFTPQWIVRLALADTFGDPSRLTDAEVAEFYDLYLRAGNRQAELHTLAGAIDPTLPDRVPMIATPTLVLWGDRDTWVPPADAAWFGAHLPHATVVMLPGLGHQPMFEDPATTAAAMESFLRPRGD